MATEANPVRAGRTAAEFIGACASVIEKRLAERASRQLAREKSEEIAELVQCAPPKAAESIAEQLLQFRQPIPIELWTGLATRRRPLSLGCDPISELSAQLSLDLIFEQSWFFRGQILSTLSSTLALGPGETIAVSITRTQRKQFDRNTVDEVERANNTESTFVDRDVLNVTRSSSRTNNWNVSGNAQLSIPDVGSLGLSGGMDESVNRTATSSAERVSEVTRKSSSNLKVLSKVDIKETTETTLRGETSRKLTNPLKDRSLLIQVFDLAKKFRVEVALRFLSPTLTFTPRFQFDRQFVLRNGDFLNRSLRDPYLQVELTNALELASDLPVGGSVKRAVIENASLALRYLFDEPNMFRLPPLPGGEDGNAPGSSFNASFGREDNPLNIGQASGFYDALQNNVGTLFTILNFYYALYQQEGFSGVSADALEADGRGKMLVDLALTLAAATSSLWIAEGIEEDLRRNVLDNRDRTEVFRRLSGYLAFVQGVIRPQLEPLEAEQEVLRRWERAEFVIRRVVDHLSCHEGYYAEAYLQYLADLTRFMTLRDFLRTVIRDRLPFAADTTPLGIVFDPADAYLNGRDIVIPSRANLEKPEADALLDALQTAHGKGGGIRFGVLTSDDVVVPTDGVHFEAAPGRCEIDLRGQRLVDLDDLGKWVVLGSPPSPPSPEDAGSGS